MNNEIKEHILNIEFDYDLVFPNHLNINNPHHIRTWCDELETKEQDTDYGKSIIHLLELVSKRTNQELGVTKEDLKEITKMLKNRDLHPKGYFDKQSRFYLEDSELVDVRSPSVKYPYSQMNAGRTAKFVKAIANKYRPQSKEDLINLFKS